MTASGGESPDATHGFIVIYRSGIDAVSETARLAGKYGFVARYLYTSALSGFAADLRNDTVARLRREPSVDYIERDQPVTIV
jgi:hypothetical protein